MKKIEAEYKKGIASVLKTDPDNIFLYWKGRVALYAALKAMGVKEGDEVIIPAFTCVVVPNAIMYLGAVPNYVDISGETYNMDVRLIEKSVSPRTKVIICQNTFGLSSDIQEIIQIAQKHNLFTIEDCTHGFGGYYNGKPNGSYCDAAFYSTQWNKPFSTGIGGFLVINNKTLISKVKSLEHEKIKPSAAERLMLASLLMFNKLFINRFSYWPLVGLYRFLSKKNLILGSNRGEEITKVAMPENYFKDTSFVQVRAGIKQLKDLEKLNNLRKKNAAAYTGFLKSNNKTFVKEKFSGNHLFLKYPLLVKDKELFLRYAGKEKVSLGDWFLSPIHPVRKNFELWKINEAFFPCGNTISKKIVNLPTDTTDIKGVFRFLQRHLDMIE